MNKRLPTEHLVIVQSTFVIYVTSNLLQSFLLLNDTLAQTRVFKGDILGSQGNEYEDDCLLRCCAMLNFRLTIIHYPDGDGSKHFKNVGQYVPDYTAQYPRRQLSSCLDSMDV